MLNDSIRYRDGELHIDDIAAREITAAVGTPTYVYSLRRVLDNLNSLESAFAKLDAHIHYSAKANANLTLLKTLIARGVGIDCVSGGELYKALAAGTVPEHLIFTGVGKRKDEIRYALEQHVGWLDVENEGELAHIQDIAAEIGRETVRLSLRLNPDVQASTHHHIATGHGKAKFGLSHEHVERILTDYADNPLLHIEGLHVHIGSQLHDIEATVAAIRKAVDLSAPYPRIHTINIGGGFPVAYQADESIPSYQEFADALEPLLRGYHVLLEPGRSLVADAGLLLTEVLYVKEQANQRFVIVDASMTELLRPALYGATHQIVPVQTSEAAASSAQVVGPVCETTDVLGASVPLPPVQPGQFLALLTTGAYGMVMSSTYNARPRPAEVLVAADGDSWRTTRQRETWADLLREELE